MPAALKSCALRVFAGAVLLWAGQALAAVTPLVTMPNFYPGAAAPVWKVGDNLLALREFNYGEAFDLVRIDPATGAVAPLKDINPASSADLANPAWTREYQGKLYFWVKDPDHGLALWRTDGTTAGTEFVMDLITDKGLASNAVPVFMVNVEDRFLFIITQDGPSFVSKLWNVDPEAGTAALVKEGGVGNANYFQLVGDNVQFVIDKVLWSTDGSAGSAATVSGPWFYGQYIALGGKSLELRSHALYDVSLVDGTRTQLSFPGSSVSGWQEIAVKANGQFLFTSYGAGLDDELWLSNGSASGTYRLTDRLPWYATAALHYKGGVLYPAHTPGGSVELRWNNGTPYHEDVLATLAPTTDYYPVRMTRAGDRVFVLKHSSCCVALWTTDGTEAGTRQVFSSPRTADQSWELMAGSDERFYLNMTDFATSNPTRLYVYTPGTAATGGGGGGAVGPVWLLPLLALGLRRRLARRRR